MIASLPVILQAGSQGGGSMLGMILPFALIFIIIYFLMIRPQSKKQKETQKMLAALQKNDKVVTIGGILGTVAGIRESDNVVILKISDNTKIEVTKTAIAKKL